MRNFGPKLNGSVGSNRKSFEKTGPPFEVDHFSRSDRLEFCLNGSRPMIQEYFESFSGRLSVVTLSLLFFWIPREDQRAGDLGGFL